MGHVLAALMPENELIMRVALYTGLRISDVLNITPQQLAAGRVFWVRELKTGKKKKVTISEKLRAQLLRNSSSLWCFPHRTDYKRHKTRQAVWADIKRAGKAFRMPQNVTPHSCRKIYAVHLMEKYGDITKVQKALNHDNMAVTAIYAMADKLSEKKGRSR